MKTYSEWLALGENRWSIREVLRADVKTLQNVYRETREEGPAATVAAFIAAVGYSRAVVVVGTLVNRHAWDGRISRSIAAWAEALPETWDEEATQHFSFYIDDVIHLAHFNQIAAELKKTTPPEDDDKRPETISADNTPETPETISAGSGEAQEAPEESPETISENEQKGQKTMKFNKVNYSILCRTETGLKYGIQTRQNVSGYSPEEYQNIGIRQKKGFWYIDHIPTGLSISMYGYKSRKAATETYIRDYSGKVEEIETKKQDFLKKAVETFQKSPLEEEAATWETVNYCTVRNWRFDKVTEAARRAGLIIQKADKITYQDGGNVNISGPSEKLENVKAIIAEFEQRDLARAAEEAAKEAAERRETIPAGSSETQEVPEAPAAEKAPEARPARQVPQKPARGPGKPLDCIGQILSGDGWKIVFDGALQRTRVIIEEAAREKAAPLAEAAGFYYSVNTDSWHKKLSQKAKRAAEALAEQLRAAC